MSTILLPALRKPWHNLYRHVTAGAVTAHSQAYSAGQGVFFGSTSSPTGLAFNDIEAISLAAVGLAPGDVISARGQVAFDAAGQTVRLRLGFSDAAFGSTGLTDSADVSTPTGFVDRTIPGVTIPANTAWMWLFTRVGGGTGNAQIRNGMINRGGSVATYETPKRGAVAPWVQAAFSRDNLQAVQLTNAGLSQITTWSSRRWLLQFDTHVLGGDELREWALALDQLSDLNNVFRIVPPGYAGPSTGYAGGNPNVNGGGQLGTSLVCDGVGGAGVNVLKAGDFASFEVTSPLGNTNVQLFKLAADATSDGVGNVTLTLTTPIRQAPADNAVVQIFSPTAQMALVAPSAGVDYGMLKRARLQVAAEERIWP